MALQVNIGQETLNYLNGPATAQLQLALEEYAEDLLGEASRLEANSKSTDGNPEITSTMVKDANVFLRHAYHHRPKNKILILSQIASTIGGFVIGLLANAQILTNNYYLAGFIVLLTITITALVIAVIKE